MAGTRFRWSKGFAYFGFTNAVGGLRGRLNQFNNTLRDKSGSGHGGAQRFRLKYRDGNPLAKKLYVAVCPFKCDVPTNKPADLRVMGDVVRAEYLAFAKYVTHYGRPPEFNDKEKSRRGKSFNTLRCKQHLSGQLVRRSLQGYSEVLRCPLPRRYQGHSGHQTRLIRAGVTSPKRDGAYPFGPRSDWGAPQSIWMGRRADRLRE